MSDDKNTLDDDFEMSRRIYHDLLVKGSEALEEMMEVARATEHPRAFEVLSNMMKNVSDVNGSLMDLHKKKSDMLKKQDVPQQLPNQTTNNLFVGSTSDLQRLLLQQRDNEEKIIDITDRLNKDD